MQNVNNKPEKRFRFGNRRHFSFIAIAALALPACAWVERGYLPAVGPAPLRFIVPAAPAANTFVPPAPPTPPAPAPEPPKPEKVSTVPPPTPAAVPVPTAQTNEVSSVQVEPDRPEEVVSPQMLIKFFNKSTNGVTGSVILPADFTPPKPAEPPHSKATYSIGP